MTGIDNSTRESAMGLSPTIVLVRPQMGENIGAAARAMLNFGVTALRLVSPRDAWPNARATAMAAGASSVLDNVELFSSVAEAIADCQYTVATTIRQRGLFLPVLEPAEALGEVNKRLGAGQRTAILFGAEKAGLETDEASYADAILTIPVNPDFSSLNLAQAVALVSYEWSRQRDLPPVFGSPYIDEVASRGEVEGMVSHMIEALDQTGYFFPPDKRPTLERNIRTLLSNAKMSPAEIQSFRGLIRQLARGARRDENSD
ncbi:MAG: RNA methyltransferase [Parvularcula sp.]